ncbi:hypothetical protein [Thalassovita autumnalis]|uniref:hypothetical protein n=1 Tax=Thalassovita autumnalis TaxID=2072972 RepID=UPI00071E4303|nr:hypothetical protein [Thalassovita autumnalis]
MINLFKSQPRAKLLRWLGYTVGLLFLAAVFWHAGASSALDLIILIASLYLGTSIGAKLAYFVSAHLLKVPKDTQQRLVTSGSVFGFLFAPALAGSCANAILGTNIVLHTLSAHFLWACLGAGLFYYIKPDKSEL